MVLPQRAVTKGQEEGWGKPLKARAREGLRAFVQEGIQSQGQNRRCQKKRFLQNPSDKRTQALIKQ